MNRDKIQVFFEKNVRDEGLYQHSVRVATIAYEIGECLGIDKDALYCYGLLHDIGKIRGSSGLRHAYDGYIILNQLDYCDRSDICLTHSFPAKIIESYAGKNDCSGNEYNFIKTYIENKNYDIYDKVIQVCDAIAGRLECKILEISMIDVAFKYGVNKFTVDLWKAYFSIFNEISERLGVSIYAIISEDVKGYDFY